MKYFIHPTQDNIAMHQIHFIVPTYLDAFHGQVQREVNQALSKFNYPSVMLSFIQKHKYNCISKEKYEEMYKINAESAEREDLSAGEHLFFILIETFIQQIKTGKYMVRHGQDDSVSFLLSLLNKEERKKLEQKDDAFLQSFNWNYRREVDVPAIEWAASESNLKFSRSICVRKTHMILNHFSTEN